MKKPCSQTTSIWSWYSSDYNSHIDLHKHQKHRRTRIYISNFKWLIIIMLMSTHACHVTDHPLVSLTMHWHWPGKASCSLTCVFVCQLDEALRDVPPPVETDHLCLHISACRLKKDTKSPWETSCCILGFEFNTFANQCRKSLTLRLQFIMFNQQRGDEFINTRCICTLEG